MTSVNAVRSLVVPGTFNSDIPCHPEIITSRKNSQSGCLGASKMDLIMGAAAGRRGGARYHPRVVVQTISDSHQRIHRITTDTPRRSDDSKSKARRLQILSPTHPRARPSFGYSS